MVRRMAVLGDSVPWGQGLLDNHKYHSILQQRLNVTQKDVVAHSGAIIGAGITRTGSADGEVPISYPTVVQQCENFRNSPEAVDLVLLTAGINDVDIRTILNPATKESDLSDDIEKSCHVDFKVLLQRVVDKFTNARIIVSGYFQILSKKSDPFHVFPFLEMLSVGVPAHLRSGPIVDRIAALALQFRDESDSKFQQSVNEINPTAGGRVKYVPLGFTEDNAAFAPTALLFGLNLNLELSPQDEVIDSRHRSCEITFPGIPNFFSREQCFRASAGHPSVAGAQRIADTIFPAIP